MTSEYYRDDEMRCDKESLNDDTSPLIPLGGTVESCPLLQRIDNNQQIVLGIVGSRLLEGGYQERLIVEKIDEWITANCNKDSVIKIVSGGATGVDTVARNYAIQRGLELKEFHANWSLGRKAGSLRNTQIVAAITHLIAFPIRESVGTMDTIRKAQHKGIPVTIHYLN